MILLACGNEFHEIIFTDCAVLNLEIGDDAAKRVEHRVENKSLQRRFGVALRRRDALYNRPEDFRDSDTGLAACTDNLIAAASEEIHNLILHLIGIGTLEIDLVDYRNYLQIRVNRHIKVGNRLSLDTLRGIHYKERALTGSD